MRILDYFLIFEFAFNLQWTEVKEDIKGYQKKLSELYEYWCYLKLTNILNKLQNTKTNYESIFDFNRKEWSIKVKRGKKSLQKFNILYKGNYFELELTYNNTFSRNDHEHYAFAIPMRPDYTLIITYHNQKFLFHFDAKYKCDLKTTFKNEDIYKMHTYKDAIKNTYGAYVLYPGRKEKIYQEFSGIIHSVGAFPLTPNNDCIQDENRIELFIKQVINEFLVIYYKNCYCEYKEQ